MHMVFKFLENVMNLGIFTHAPLLTQNLHRSSYHHILGRGKLLIPPGCIFSKNFPPIVERGGGNYDFFIKIQSKNMKMTWNNRLLIFCMIWNSLK